MNFKTYLNQAWTDHAPEPQRVAREFIQGVTLIETNEQLAELAGLATHVFGEHLNQWSEGLRFVLDLKKNKHYLAGTETEKTLLRSQAILEMASGKNPDLELFSVSDQIRIFAATAAAVSTINITSSKELLTKAVHLAESGLDKKDPAYRSLAVTGNNLASALEEKKSRTNQETELMIFAAKTARKFWEIAGTWVEVSRAEYRLAMTYLQAKDLKSALFHAEACLQICVNHKADDLDMFFAYEVLTLVYRAQNNESMYKNSLSQAEAYFSKLNHDDQAWCQPILVNLK